MPEHITSPRDMNQMAYEKDPPKGTPEYFAKYPWARIEEPSIEKGTGFHDEKITHPAFGQVQVSRISGHTTLYDSEFNHAHYVRVTVHRSELNRSLSRDWHFAKSEIVEFDLSEAQWATFVSSFGNGSGTPCTLKFIAGQGHMPQIPEPRIEKNLHSCH